MRKERGKKELRKIVFIPNYLKHPDGSCFVQMGETRVICSAIVEEKVPPFLKGTGTGWITAEYGMLPGSTEKRTIREKVTGRITGRTHEIQRIIGRSLRAMIDLELLGERTIFVDCDVIQADGGTRTASVNAGAVAVHLAIKKLIFNNRIAKNPLKYLVAGISVGIVDGELLLDLDYEEDSRADVDLNVFFTENEEIVEIQGTGENKTFTMRELFKLLLLAEEGTKKIFNLQREAIEKGYEKIISDFN